MHSLHGFRVKVCNDASHGAQHVRVHPSAQHHTEYAHDALPVRHRGLRNGNNARLLTKQSTNNERKPETRREKIIDKKGNVHQRLLIKQYTITNVNEA